MYLLNVILWVHNSFMFYYVFSTYNSIIFYFLDFLFPASTRIEYLKICETRDIKLFCRDFVEKSEFMFLVGTFGVILILISLVRIKTVFMKLYIFGEFVLK